MPEESADASPDEQALASMFRKLERSLGRSPDIEELLRQHPRLAGEIRDLEAMRQALDLSRPRPDRPMPQRLGEFRIVRRLETGGMGDVYEAWQEPLHRRVAIKVLRHGHHSPATQERFMREQRVLAQLHQTNIVPIHTAGREGDFEYFAMPFIDGAALRHVVQAAVEFGTARPGTKTPSIADLLGLALASAKALSAVVPASPPPGVAARSGTRARSSDYRPSLDYLRSVARVMADAAQAVQHAHEQGILHRDIKPSNIMVEVHATADGRRPDQCWVIDFGLASYRGAAAAGESAFAAGHSVQPAVGPDAVPTISGVMGTPAYMAPEQFEGRADERADIWGLGVTLYELLTLRRAFPAPESGSDVERYGAVRELVRNADPPRPRGVIPRDLEAICFRALRKDPGRRYATAGELAEDLRRWLRGEAVVARCDEAPWLAAPIRSARWARRNKGWATAMGVTAAAIAAAVLSVFLLTDAHRREAERAYALLQLGLVNSESHEPGWSEKARRRALEIGQEPDDDRLRDVFASTLSGMDAHVRTQRGVRTSSLAFDASGDELLLGGAPEMAGYPALRAGSWTLGSEPRLTGLAAPGPVTCRPDGRRVQFVPVDGLDYALWDISSNVRLASFSLAGGDPVLDRPVIDEIHLPVLAMAADGSVVAASVTGPRVDDKESSAGAVGVWDAVTGGLLGRFPIRATALALAADGGYMAAGDTHGDVGVWRLPSGMRVATAQAGADEIESLAFGVNPLDTHSPALDGPDFQLAIGCTTGRVVVWDSVHGHLRSTCRGMNNRALSLAFNPDGTLLAGGGSGATIWDSATGAALIEFGLTFTNAVAFSRDGLQLAAADYAKFNHPGGVQVWNLEPGRGIRTLRGLDMSVSVVAFSADSRQVAALSNDWRVAIWDCDTGEQLRVMEAPRGYTCDNAGLCFNADGSRLACITGTAAVLWEVASGTELQLWPLPAGLIDQLVFDAHGDLIAARCEPAVFEGLPVERTNGICRVRNLSRADWNTPLLEVADFGIKVIDIALDPVGKWLVIEGDSMEPSGKLHSIRAFDIATGQQLWSLPCSKTGDNADLHVDPRGEFLSCQTADDGDRVLVTMPEGVAVHASAPAVCLGPGAEVLISEVANEHNVPVGLFRRESARPFLCLRQVVSARAAMDLSGSMIACGNVDGTVTLGDLELIRKNLAGAGLGW